MPTKKRNNGPMRIVDVASDDEVARSLQIFGWCNSRSLVWIPRPMKCGWDTRLRFLQLTGGSAIEKVRDRMV